jgi:hypothetical protein
MDLGTILVNAARDPAMVRQLIAHVQADPRMYVSNLATDLANTSLVIDGRHQAALQFKNALNNVTQEPALEGVWASIDSWSKVDIRNKVLGTLADTESNLRNVAALAVAAIAKLDIPDG